MAKQTLLDDILELVKSACFYLPFWAVPILATTVAGGAYWLAGKFFALMPAFADTSFAQFPLWIAGFVFLVTFVAGLSGWLERKRRKQLAAQTQTLQKLRDLSWREFELLTAEAYRQQGFTVTEGSVNAPDGVIDLIATAPGGGRHLIQCKHWKTSKIGVKVVRETLGVLTKEGGAQAVVIGTGEFTRDALRFAVGQPIQLINGAQLLELLNQNEASTSAPATKPNPLATPPADQIRTSPVPTTAYQPVKAKEPSPDIAFMPQPEEELCPKCGSELTKRVAKRGANAGNAFWGCTEYPRCQYTKAM